MDLIKLKNGLIKKLKNVKLSELNKFLKQLNNLYNINSGGCCYIAYLIASHFNNLNIPFKLLIQSGKDIGNHYCLIVHKTKINSLENYEYEIKLIASPNTIKRIYDENQWSKKYNIKYNKLISIKIREFFKPYYKKYE